MSLMKMRKSFDVYERVEYGEAIKHLEFYSTYKTEEEAMFAIIEACGRSTWTKNYVIIPSYSLESCEENEE